MLRSAGGPAAGLERASPHGLDRRWLAVPTGDQHVAVGLPGLRQHVRHLKAGVGQRAVIQRDHGVRPVCAQPGAPVRTDGEAHPGTPRQPVLITGDRLDVDVLG